MVFQSVPRLAFQLGQSAALAANTRSDARIQVNRLDGAMAVVMVDRLGDNTHVLISNPGGRVHPAV